MGATDSSDTDRELMTAADVGRTISRIAHEIIEKTALDGPDAPRVVLLGIPTRGVTLAARLAEKIQEFAGVDGSARRARHHALPRRPRHQAAATAGGDVDPRRRHRRHGRRARRRRAVYRAAPCAPRSTRCATSGGRARCSSRCSSTAGTANCPLRADYVGKNVPTSRSDNVKVRLTEHDGHDGVTIASHGGPVR